MGLGGQMDGGHGMPEWPDGESGHVGEEIWTYDGGWVGMEEMRGGHGEGTGWRLEEKDCKKSCILAILLYNIIIPGLFILFFFITYLYIVFFF